MKPIRPFMIERDGKAHGDPGKDFAVLRYVAPTIVRVRWVTWEGSRWPTRKAAQDEIDMWPDHFVGGRVIEIIDEVRTTIPAR